MTTSVALPSPTRPWGASRLAPYPTAIRRPHATVAIDPTTQLGVFRDRVGQVVDMGKHGTSSGTETSVTNRYGRPVQSSDFNEKWQRVVPRAGLPERARFHDLKSFLHLHSRRPRQA
ncbi:putative ATP-grasp-modified RiPP [Streptomyces sp. LaBMicrA B280]|uniref:putative ATP-grasp-modified RiPP n=1 Tax=Streptomyces sp. LaBMicrA B280 TaxID=3391001 RepID=UPI003BA744FD